MRTWLRRFLKWSADQAGKHGLTPNQHQLLLAVRGHPEAAGPTISDIAQYLQLRHHSTVELVDRAEHNRLVERRADPDDRRLVRVQLAPEGVDRLEALSWAHLQELNRLVPRLARLWVQLDDATGPESEVHHLIASGDVLDPLHPISD